VNLEIPLSNIIGRGGWGVKVISRIAHSNQKFCLVESHSIDVIYLNFCINFIVVICHGEWADKQTDEQIEREVTLNTQNLLTFARTVILISQVKTSLDDHLYNETNYFHIL
jgi:hypothetical protein